MAQSLKAKFDGNRQEVLNYAGRYGIHPACDKYGVTYLPMRRFLIEETGDENYGTNPQFTRLYPTSGKSMLDQFLEKFADYVVRKDIEIKKKEERIRLLEAELEHYQGREIEDTECQLISIMQACEA